MASVLGRDLRLRRLGEAGQATVEFALILPALLLLILAMLDFGKAFNYWIDETHLANAAARWAIVNQTPDPTLASPCTSKSSAISCQVRQEANTAEMRSGGGSSVSSPVAITFCLPTGSGIAGNPVKVSATVTYNWLGFLTGPFGITGLGSTKTISGTATMRLEQGYNASTAYYTPQACP
jgi:Flp pilus assembly protein TadG